MKTKITKNWFHWTVVSIIALHMSVSLSLAAECKVPYNCKENINKCVIKKRIFANQTDFIKWVNEYPNSEFMILTAVSSVVIIYKDGCVNTIECRDINGICTI